MCGPIHVIVDLGVHWEQKCDCLEPNVTKISGDTKKNYTAVSWGKMQLTNFQLIKPIFFIFLEDGSQG